LPYLLLKERGEACLIVKELLSAFHPIRRYERGFAPEDFFGFFLRTMRRLMGRRSTMNNIPLDDQTPTISRLSTNAGEDHRSELRFWQGVALSLALFVLSLLASLFLGLGSLLLSR
jgi:hypothetical protein